MRCTVHSMLFLHSFLLKLKKNSGTRQCVETLILHGSFSLVLPKFSKWSSPNNVKIKGQLSLQTQGPLVAQLMLSTPQQAHKKSDHSYERRHFPELIEDTT